MAQQEPQETPLEWHTRLRELHATAYPNRQANQDPDLMQTFALGLCDASASEETLKRIGNGQGVTYAQCLQTAQSQVAVTNLIRKREGKTSGINSMQGPKEYANTQVRKCFVCDSPLHLKKDCSVIKAVKSVLREWGIQGNSGQGNSGRVEKPRGGYQGRGNYRGGNYRGNFYRGNRGGRGGFSRGSINEMSGTSHPSEPQAGPSDEYGQGFDTFNPYQGEEAAESNPDAGEGTSNRDLNC